MEKIKNPQELGKKLCSLLPDEKDPSIKLGSTSKQDCETFMNTVLTPLVEPDNCDIEEIVEMATKLGILQKDILERIPTPQRQDTLTNMRDLNKSVQQTVQSRFVTVCRCDFPEDLAPSRKFDTPPIIFDPKLIEAEEKRRQKKK